MTTSNEHLADVNKSQNGSTVTLESTEASVVGQSAEMLDYSCAGKTKRALRAVYKVVRSLVGIIVLLICYSLLGALIFMVVESSHEDHYKTNITKTRNNVIEDLLQKSLNLTSQPTSVEQWKARAEKLLIDYEYTVADAVINGVKTNSTVEVWTFWTSLFFVGTVFTTIGYGNQAPVTDAGRLICILYASIGIPLALLVLAEVGKKFTVALKFVWAIVRRYYYGGHCRKIRKPFQSKYQLSSDGNEVETKSEDEKIHDRSRSGSRIVYGYEVDNEFNLPISVAVAILIVYIILGGFMYMIWEQWDFVDSVYFVFISISTIGFGDVVPAHPKFFILSSVYIFIGLSLVSMCVNVAIEFFTSTVVDRAKQKMDEAKLKMGEAKHKMGEAKKKIGEKVNQASKNAKEKCAELKTNIIDETTKIRQMTDEKFKKHGSSPSRSSTPLSDAVTGTPSRSKENLNEQNINSEVSEKEHAGEKPRGQPKHVDDENRL